MDSRLSSAMCVVLGAACLALGFFGKDLRSDVEMPMTEAEKVDRTPPSRTARAFYVLFSACLLVYGLLTFSR
jgi:hypothetical protein